MYELNIYGIKEAGSEEPAFLLFSMVVGVLNNGDTLITKFYTIIY